ncbi:hypothetical protein [Escherichia coli]|uniref:hypothetical protein n=1 Tax=Escherichia coli TaxID=562 RepID=UPI0020238758|nr:hypothetical protein [Escherichia coli]
MTRMSTIYSRLSYGTGTTLTGCGVSAKAYAETAKTAKEVSWMLADRIAGLSLSDWAIIVGSRRNRQHSRWNTSVGSAALPGAGEPTY